MPTIGATRCDDEAACAAEGCGGTVAAGRAVVMVAVALGCPAGVGRGPIVAPADVGVSVVAGVDAELNSAPQCTQNLALGWFSLPQAPHFIVAISCNDSRQTVLG